MDKKSHSSKDMIIDGSIETVKEDDSYEDDYVVKSMGASGKWQAIVCCIAASSRLIGMWNMLSIIFLAPETEFKCVRFKENFTEEAENSTCYNTCEEYQYYEYVFSTTLISDYDLICDRAWLANFTQMVLMLGLLIGASLFGWISDRFGRRNAMILSASTAVIFMLGAVFAPNYWTFTILRFFVGISSGGIMSITAVFTLEIVGPQYRELAIGLAMMPDAIAELTVAGFAYFSPSWEKYLLGFSMASMVILIILLFMPETPRWLVTNGQADRAVQVMTKAAKFNNINSSGIRDTVTKSLQELNLKENEAPKYNYTDLFKTKKLAITTVASFTIWFFTGICFFGLNQYTSGLGSNIFVVVAIMGCIQMPLSPLASLVAKVFGRRASTMGTFIISGLSMVCLIFVPSDSWMSSLFGIIGVSSAYLNFCVIYIYVTELYPTPVRNMGFSVSASGSKFGATLAPFLANLRPRWVASTIFAVLPMTAAAICLLLPETKGKKLCDTVEEQS